MISFRIKFVGDISEDKQEMLMLKIKIELKTLQSLIHLVTM
jgi:hypothetical protein